MITENINKKLKSLIELAPIMHEALPFDGMIGITDTEKFLLYIPAKNLNVGDVTGRSIPEHDAIYEAIRTKQTQSIVVPREAFGIPFKANGVPIKDQDSNVIGGFGIGVSLDYQDKLSNLSQQFASTSEEISASLEDLASSSMNLAHSMEELDSSQNEMINQFKKTEDILKFINQVASNSKILGLNAGIEAARSGEQGKGFGVVAQEITKLAESSAKSVDEINALIDLLKEQVNTIAQTVKKTKAISQHQSEATADIASAINDLAAASKIMEELAKKI